jgi:hypothetical protein
MARPTAAMVFQKGSGIESCWLIDSNTKSLYKFFGV